MPNLNLNLPARFVVPSPCFVGYTAPDKTGGFFRADLMAYIVQLVSGGTLVHMQDGNTVTMTESLDVFIERLTHA